MASILADKLLIDSGVTMFKKKLGCSQKQDEVGLTLVLEVLNLLARRILGTAEAFTHDLAATVLERANARCLVHYALASLHIVHPAALVGGAGPHHA